jgi:hypothetical protein
MGQNPANDCSILDDRQEPEPPAAPGARQHIEAARLRATSPPQRSAELEALRRDLAEARRAIEAERPFANGRHP